MSVSYSAVAAVGFLVTAEELKQGYEIMEAMGKEVGEGSCTSILQLSRGINYITYSDLIDTFKQYFPYLPAETHQLDLFVGLKVS